MSDGLSPFAAAALLFGVVFSGDAFLRAAGLSRRDADVAWFGWAIATGLLAFGVALVACFAAAAPLPALSAAVVVGGAAAAAWRIARRRAAHAATVDATAAATKTAETPPPHAGRLERAAFALATTFVVLCAVDRAVLSREMPISNDDELFIWEVRGRALLHAGALDARYGALVKETIETPIGPHRRVRHADYPLLLPAWAAGIHAASGGNGGVDVRLPTQAVNVALVLALAGALARRLRPYAAALALLAAAGGRASIGDAAFVADSTVALGLLLALDAIDRSRTAPRAGFAFLAVVGVSLAAFAKNEGMAAAAAAVVAAFLAAPSPRRPTRFAPAIATALFCGLAFGVAAAFDLKNDLLGGNATGESFLDVAWRLRAERPFAVAAVVARDVLFSFEGSGGVFVAAAALALLRPKLLARPSPFGFATLAMFGLYALVYVGTPSDLDWHWSTSGRRVFGQLVPAAVVAAAASAAAVLGPRLNVDRSTIADAPRSSC